MTAKMPAAATMPEPHPQRWVLGTRAGRPGHAQVGRLRGTTNAAAWRVSTGSRARLQQRRHRPLRDHRPPHGKALRGAAGGAARASVVWLAARAKSVDVTEVARAPRRRAAALAPCVRSLHSPATLSAPPSGRTFAARCAVVQSPRRFRLPRTRRNRRVEASVRPATAGGRHFRQDRLPRLDRRR